VFNFIGKWIGKLWIKVLLLLVVLGIAATLYLDNVIRHTFTDKKWSIPSTVYARPLELYQGAVLSQDDLKTELQLLGYQFVKQVSQPKQAAN